MPERFPPPAEPPPQRVPGCPRCGGELVRTELPRGAFGLPGEPCADCNDLSPSRPVPWACRRCGGVYLFDVVPEG